MHCACERETSDAKQMLLVIVCREIMKTYRGADDLEARSRIITPAKESKRGMKKYGRAASDDAQASSSLVHSDEEDAVLNDDEDEI